MAPKRNTSKATKPKPWDNGINISPQEAWFMLSVLSHIEGKPSNVDWKAVKRDMNYASTETTKVRWGQVMRKLQREQIAAGDYAYIGSDANDDDTDNNGRGGGGGGGGGGKGKKANKAAGTDPDHVKKRAPAKTGTAPANRKNGRTYLSAQVAIDSDDELEDAPEQPPRPPLGRTVINLTDEDDDDAVQSQLRQESYTGHHPTGGGRAISERTHGYTGFDPQAARRAASIHESNLTPSATRVAAATNSNTNTYTPARTLVAQDEDRDGGGNQDRPVFRGVLRPVGSGTGGISSWFNRQNNNNNNNGSRGNTPATPTNATHGSNGNSAADEANNWGYQGPGRLPNGEIDLHAVPLHPAALARQSAERNHRELGAACAASAAGAGQGAEDSDANMRDWTAAEPARRR
ncbi:hypothetical protein QBC44DRAFT_377022 [Cladorrhinum sp. PSN332]|nr:hypothetical protein QBC44DRAFT_377022 [Cladorrhinum sp. PSN332]